MMKGKELVKKWILALESGKFEQGMGRLIAQYDNNSYAYCCLGVLGRVCGFSKEKLSSGCNNNDYYEFTEDWWEKRGMDDLKIDQSRLITLNDERDYSFKKIASYLRNKIQWRKK